MVVSYSSEALATSIDERDVDQDNEELPSLALSGAQASTSRLYNRANDGYIHAMWR